MVHGMSSSDRGEGKRGEENVFPMKGVFGTVYMLERPIRCLKRYICIPQHAKRSSGNGCGRGRRKG